MGQAFFSMSVGWGLMITLFLFDKKKIYIVAIWGLDCWNGILAVGIDGRIDGGSPALSRINQARSCLQGPSG